MKQTLKHLDLRRLRDVFPSVEVQIVDKNVDITYDNKDGVLPVVEVTTSDTCKITPAEQDIIIREAEAVVIDILLGLKGSDT